MAKPRSRDPGAQQMRKCQGRCGLMKGINAFRPYSVLCNDCRKNPPPAPPVVELVVDEKLEAFIRSTREAAGVPAGGSR